MILDGRVPGWRSRLNEAIKASTARHLKPGDHDCAIFLASCVYALTGVDLAEKYRGRYGTIEDGYALLSADGFETIEAHIAAHFQQLPHHTQAVTGDIAVISDAGGAERTGIVDQDRVRVVMQTGSGLVPRSRMIRAYAVGRRIS